MKNCEQCIITFPKKLLHSFVSSDNPDIVLTICPICALHNIRLAHNMPNFEFQTLANKQRYKAALDYLRKKIAQLN